MILQPSIDSSIVAWEEIVMGRQACIKIDLPDIYEEYLDWYAKARQVPYPRVRHARRVLRAFHQYLKRSKIELVCLKIEQVDAFLAGFQATYKPATCRQYRCFVRGFLRYLYQQRSLLKQDLSSLLVGARQWAQPKPPKFLRPEEVQRLFASLKLSSPCDIRSYALVHLAYTLGVRPKEISLIRLDDISFGKAELTIKDRKGQNPITLPLPEQTMKAIVAYMIGGRPNSEERTLFLTLYPPYRPMTQNLVVQYLAKCMREAKVPGSAYWLRHTYAQNLLEAGVSIFEIKHMLGHNRIESTNSYLHVHIKLMREVLFDETL